MTIMHPTVFLPSQIEHEMPIPLDNGDLARAITRLAGHINAAQYRFLKMLAALVERKAWGGNGIKSPAHWLNYYCGINLGAAREKVRVAKCLATLPKIDAAFRSGAISYSKVRAMTRSATPENEDFLLRIAQHGTAQHVENLVRKYQRVRRCADRDSGKGQLDQSQYEAREFRWHYGEDGMLEFKGKLPPEQGAVFLKAIDTVLQSLHKDYDKVADAENPATAEDLQAKDVPAETSLSGLSTPTSSCGQKRADALAMLAEHALQSLDRGLAAMTGSDKYQVIVHIEADKLTAAPGDADAWSARSLCSLEDGPFLSPQTARRLACDSGLLVVLQDSQGEVLNIARKTRTIPPALRRALNMRDHSCRFPGCCQSRFTDAHHIKHWCDGGETRLDNLILLCRYHHRLLHNEGYAINKDVEGNFVFHRADEDQLRQAIYPQFTDEVAFLVESLAIENEHQSMGLGITSQTAITEWQGEVMDYGLAVGTLLNIEEQRLWVGD